MKKMKIKNITLEQGRPKIAVPLTGRTHGEIIRQVKAAVKEPCDVLEWRADYFFGEMDSLAEKIENTDAHVEMIRILDDIDYQTGGIPVIFTLRSRDSGGRVSISRENAFDLAGLAAQSKLVDFVDIELFDDGDTYDAEQMLAEIDEIHSFGVKVILSYHDFEGMPSVSEAINLGTHMRNLGADIVKIAGTASVEKDAADLMKAAAFLTEGEGGPAILVAMGIPGVRSRIAGGKYGSCITYAKGTEGTAPGQIEASHLARLLDEYYAKK